MTIVRVAGTDPGTSSLDVLVLVDGQVGEQERFFPDQLRADPALPVRWLEQRGPFALVAAPSGYGLPLVGVQQATDRERWLLSLVRPDEPDAQGVAGFSRMVEAFCASSLQAVFLPGVIHLPTVPVHRKANRIDLGTADKLCVAALALHLQTQRRGCSPRDCSFCLVELGSAFTACLLVSQGQIVDGVGGTSGALGWQSGGAWDGETAYLCGPLRKADLFSGGAESWQEAGARATILAESVQRVVAGMLAVTDVPEILLSGRLLQTHPEVGARVHQALERLRPIDHLGEGLPGAWVKHAAQGSWLLADGLARESSTLLESLHLRGASGSVLDGLYPGMQGRSQWLP